MKLSLCLATYKRAHLLFMDEDRLARLLTNPHRPVQIIFAGKAHPAFGRDDVAIEQRLLARVEQRKRAAGKTKREALRCLKRRLSDIVFTTMRHDAAGASPQLRSLTLPTEAGVGAAVANEARLTA